MFRGAARFDQSLDGWDVSRVNDMASMFDRAASFNQRLDSWNMKNVRHLRRMFREADAFDQSLDSWDLSNAMNLSQMFAGALSFSKSTSGMLASVSPNAKTNDMTVGAICCPDNAVGQGRSSAGGENHG